MRFQAQNLGMGKGGKMNKSSLEVVGLIVGLLAVMPAVAASNLSTCLDGRYPALCDHTALTPEQLKQVHAAEHRANLNACLDGRYPALCRHLDLTNEEALRVRKAEHAANLKSCLDGRYPALCRHEDLTTEEQQLVRQAEHAANLKQCLQGTYPALCRHGDLLPEEATRVQAAEAAHPQRPAPRMARRRGSSGGYSGCEDGHWIEEVMDDGGVIKLEDGSLWEVDAGDTVDSALWLPVTDVLVCDDKIINTDDNETVHVRRIR